MTQRMINDELLVDYSVRVPVPLPSSVPRSGQRSACLRRVSSAPDCIRRYVHMTVTVVCLAVSSAHALYYSFTSILHYRSCLLCSCCC